MCLRCTARLLPLYHTCAHTNVCTTRALVWVGMTACNRLRVHVRERNTPHAWELCTSRVRVLQATCASCVRACQVGRELYCRCNEIKIYTSSIDHYLFTRWTSTSWYRHWGRDGYRQSSRKRKHIRHMQSSQVRESIRIWRRRASAITTEWNGESTTTCEWKGHQQQCVRMRKRSTSSHWRVKGSTSRHGKVKESTSSHGVREREHQQP